MKKWYKINAKAQSLDIEIFDEIGYFGVNATEILKSVSQNKADNINVSIHSPGGSAFDGIAIHNALKNSSAHVTTSVVGVAASAASILYMAGDERIIPENAYLMIHDPWIFAMGNADDFQKYADDLNQFATSMTRIYAASTDLDEAHIRDLMKEETWMDGAEAHELGFATELRSEQAVAALSKKHQEYFSKLPADLRTDIHKLKNVKDIREYEIALGELGLSNKVAEMAAVAAKKLFQGEPVKVDEPELDSVLDGMLCLFENLKKGTKT